jgi:hypothetical protein
VSLIALIEMAGGEAELVQGYLSLLTLVPQLAINIKRCHDRDRSAWFMLIALVPLVNLWYLVELGFLPGTKGANHFGADPHEDKQSSIDELPEWHKRHGVDMLAAPDPHRSARQPSWSLTRAEAPENTHPPDATKGERNVCTTCGSSLRLHAHVCGTSQMV